MERLQKGKLRIFIAEERGQILGFVPYNDGHWREEVDWLVVSERADRRLMVNALLQAEYGVNGAPAKSGFRDRA